MLHSCPSGTTILTHASLPGAAGFGAARLRGRGYPCMPAHHAVHFYEQIHSSLQGDIWGSWVRKKEAHAGAHEPATHSSMPCKHSFSQGVIRVRNKDAHLCAHVPATHSSMPCKHPFSQGVRKKDAHYCAHVAHFCAHVPATHFGIPCKHPYSQGVIWGSWVRNKEAQWVTIPILQPRVGPGGAEDAGIPRMGYLLSMSTCNHRNCDLVKVGLKQRIGPAGAEDAGIPKVGFLSSMCTCTQGGVPVEREHVQSS
eukprot:1157246-Pelagomonas_calceolata.AAC.8